MFFRASARDEARRLGLAGWVRNLTDGRVELVAQGSPEKVDQFLGWCRDGPPGARVEAVDATDEEPESGLSHFRVRSSG